MSKCKVCGYRLGDGVTKCPMCGAMAGSTVAGEVSPDLNLPKYTCPACNAQLIGEHRYCTSCGADLKNVGMTVASREPKQVQVQPDKLQGQTASPTQKSSETGRTVAFYITYIIVTMLSFFALMFAGQALGLSATLTAIITPVVILVEALIVQKIFRVI